MRLIINYKNAAKYEKCSYYFHYYLLFKTPASTEKKFKIIIIALRVRQKRE